MVDLKLQLPETFFEEEERSGFLVSSEMKKLWAVELDLLNELIRVCKKYNISYYADGGTLLGTVRHGGFIPWDDDIDIAMPRSDYYRLCQVAGKEFKDPYFFQTEQTDPGSIRGHAQLRNCYTTGILKTELKYKYPFNQGIFIDIFPLDSVPDSKTDRKKIAQKIDEYRSKSRKYVKYYLGINDSVGFKRVLKDKYLKIFRCMHKTYHNKYFEKLEALKCSYNNTETDKMSNLCLGGGEVERYTIKKKWYENSEIKPFEMLELPVPANYDNVLKRIYGDWKTFVVGTTIHGGIIFDTERSYLEYLNDQADS